MSSETHKVIITASCKSYGEVFNSVTVIYGTTVSPKALLPYSPTWPDGSREVRGARNGNVDGRGGHVSLIKPVRPVFYSPPFLPAVLSTQRILVMT